MHLSRYLPKRASSFCADIPSPFFSLLDQCSGRVNKFILVCVSCKKKNAAQATNEAALVQAQTVPVQSKPIVLVYTLDTVAPQAEEGASAVEKKSSIQRVVAFANDVKHSDPLSEFRGMKEELLAINLRKKTSKKN